MIIDYIVKAVIFLGLMSVIILWAVPLHFVVGGGCEQVNILPNESPAFSNMIKDAGPIGQRYFIKMEDTGPIQQRCSIKTEDAGPIQQRCSIKTEDAGPIEVAYIAEEVASIEQIYCIIKTEEDVSVEHKDYSVLTENAKSVEQEHHVQRDAAEEVDMEVKSLETNFKMFKDVFTLLITDLSVI